MDGEVRIGKNGKEEKGNRKRGGAKMAASGQRDSVPNSAPLGLVGGNRRAEEEEGRS